MDVEVARVLKKNTSVKPCNQPSDLSGMHERFFYKDPLGIVYKLLEV